jgi:haloacid dehalogenase-like hydrolase
MCMVKSERQPFLAPGLQLQEVSTVLMLSSPSAQPSLRSSSEAPQAHDGSRAQVLGYTDFPKDDASRPADFFDEPPDRDLTVTCIVGIKDPVRQEVPGAVRTCNRAGIVVRMVTGDNIHTAQHIARECGILTDTGFAIEGPDFRNTPRVEMMERLPQLQARPHCKANEPLPSDCLVRPRL